MYAIKYQETIVPELDEVGLLRDPAQWNEAVASAIAAHHGIGPLTEAHFRFIYALRGYYQKYKVPPAMSLLCRKQNMDVNCVQRLFCTCLMAWSVSGLPDPGEEAKTYLSAM